MADVCASVCAWRVSECVLVYLRPIAQTGNSREGGCQSRGILVFGHQPLLPGTRYNLCHEKYSNGLTRHESNPPQTQHLCEP